MALNVLVVDDSALMRNIVIKVLKMSQVDIGEIFQASNGKEGLDLLSDNWIDLALIDINMPIMNGLDLLKAIRDNDETHDTPVIMVSSESQEQRLAVIQEYGAGFVHKPFAPESLRDQILKTTGVVL